MSYEAHRALFNAAANRLGKIQRLVSLVDSDDGVTDDETVFDKAYMESVGVADVTGTYAAAIVDLYTMLSGGESGGLILIGANELVVNDNGVGCGVAPESGHDLKTGTGDVDFGGDVLITGTLDVTGDTTLGNLEITTTDRLLIADFDLRFTEANHTATLGNEREIFSIDAKGNLVYTNPYNSTETLELDATYGNAGGLILDSGGAGTGRVGFNMMDLPHMYMSELDASFEDQKGQGHTKLGITMVTEGWGPTINFISMNTGASIANQGLKFIDDNTGEYWTLFRNVSGGVDSIDLKYGTDAILKIRDDVFWVTSGTGSDAIFQITGTNNEAIQFVKAIPVLPCLSERGIVDTSYGTGIRVSWRGEEEYMVRMALDGYSEIDSFRIFFEDSTDAGANPNIALGMPLGDIANPIDCLNVMDSPFMVGVNCDHIWLTANHASKEGLWVGRGDGSSTHKAARLWLQDNTAYRSSIMWGNVEEQFYSFMQEGVLRTTDNATPNNFGNSVLGFHSIPTWTSTETLGTGDAAIEVELQASVSDIHAGAAVLIEDTAGDTQLWIVDPDLANWSKIAVAGKVAVS